MRKACSEAIHLILFHNTNQQNQQYIMDSRNIVGFRGLSVNRNKKSEQCPPTPQIHLIHSSNSLKERSVGKSLKKAQSVHEPYDKKMKSSQPSYEQLNTHIKMKEKFEDLYKRIKKISMKNGWDQSINKHQHRFIVYPSEQFSKRQSEHSDYIKREYSKLKSNSFWDQAISLHKEQSAPNLQINTISKQSSNTELFKLKLFRNTRYKPKLISNKKNNLSNNIRDYLSVEKINFRDSSEVATEKAHHQRKYSRGIKQILDHNFIQNTTQKLETNLLFENQGEKGKCSDKQQSPTLPRFPLNRTIYKKKKTKFEPPFQTYFYRDLIWKIAYSNELQLQFPAQYQSKIKIFVGNGNNSRLVKSIIKRRAWYQITDKINEAIVIWTQIKVQNVFNWQLKNSKKAQKKSMNLSETVNEEEKYERNLIWTGYEQKQFCRYFECYQHVEAKASTDLKFRNKKLRNSFSDMTPPISETQKKSIPDKDHNNKKSLTMKQFLSSNIPKIKIHNHMINNYIIGNKKALFQTMKQYYAKNNDDAFKYLPITFHICNGIDDDQYLKFLNIYYSYAKKTGDYEESNSQYNAWIVKPGENTNRGNGIIVCLTLDAIKNILKKKEKYNDGSQRTYIIQKYIQKPLLYKKRKFDIRHFILINCCNGLIKGYWYKQGYLRTTSSQYTLKQSSGNIHLTNDAVQKNLPDYGKYEKGNKLSYEDFQNYLNKLSPDLNFWKQAYPVMKKIANDVIRASAHNVDPERRTNNFQIFGLDFMLDVNLNVWLIEVNSNPCLEVSCPLLAKIIPKLLEDTFKICLDPIYSPPLNFNPKSTTFKENCLKQIQYELVYDERFELKSSAGSKLLNDEKFMKGEDDYFDDDGEQLTED